MTIKMYQNTQTGHSMVVIKQGRKTTISYRIGVRHATKTYKPETTKELALARDEFKRVYQAVNPNNKVEY